MPKSKILYMAGIWQPTEHYNQFTILTTAPNESMRPVHDRMPLVLKPEEITPWIQDWGSAEKLLYKTPPLLEHKQEYEQLAYKKIKITDHVTACENVIINEQSQYFLFRREERSSICEIL